GDLYRFMDQVNSQITLKVNGSPVPSTPVKGYVQLTRDWNRGDVIEMTLPMPIRRVVANPQVTADAGRVAIQRGPIVYCAEWPDNPEGHVRNLMLTDDSKLAHEFKPGLLNGVVVVKGKALALSLGDDGNVVRKEQDFMAIPYYAWAHRGSGEMVVWLPNSEAGAKLPAVATIASKSKVRASESQNPNLVVAINDQSEPRSSRDSSDVYFHWWPKKGTSEWVEYSFDKPYSISESEIYWFDDTGRGECRVPASWRLMYKDGDAWKPVENVESYGVDKDRFNRVTFKPVTTTGLRIEITMQSNWSAGIQEWKVK
ncbi:MAG TPA: glycoside hydrolase family 127 protein, partial [Blastocatellia bacterium]|nr:glycoside hydrolase family 127 protein [Blastocatellia bacterium]